MFFTFLPDSCQIFTKESRDAYHLFTIFTLILKKYKCKQKNTNQNICVSLDNIFFCLCSFFHGKYGKMVNYSLSIPKYAGKYLDKYLGKNSRGHDMNCKTYQLCPIIQYFAEAGYQLSLRVLNFFNSDPAFCAQTYHYLPFKRGSCVHLSRHKIPLCHNFNSYIFIRWIF